MLAVQYVKSIPNWLLLKSLGRLWSGLATSPLGLVRLREVPEPRLPGPRWCRVRPILSGICGSDLGSITAAGSVYFGPVTSFPFTFGHEVVGRVVEVGPEVRHVRPGDRVVLEPALGCEVRQIEPLCPACRDGAHGNCVNIVRGVIGPGVQTGFCRDTGGGWSSSLVAHEVQLHRVPDTLSDEEAVLLEPFACALHAVLRAPRHRIGLVVGCGTMGLLTITAAKILDRCEQLIALAKHPHQQEQAARLGADFVLPPGRNGRDRVCELVGATQHYAEIGPPTILGGVDVVFDCVGSDRSLDESLRLTRARGTTVVVGMPGLPWGVDWTTIWFKELNVCGAYAYGLEDMSGKRISTFDLALDLLVSRRVDLKPLVTHRFPLTQYRQAIRTALLTGRFRSIKTVFTIDAAAS
ncbi:MAG: zinc-binding dehydrogenase [Gemmatales bacterium]|nr:zinc-binding dehydrogenase [Gemmatales bacterium]MDW8387364.1 zinc-binding dehydrogenase [Gemmatales bacterium]